MQFHKKFIIYLNFCFGLKQNVKDWQNINLILNLENYLKFSTHINE